jgi:hypothetical protein
MASLTSLVLTVTLLAVQLAMGSSPRIVGALLTDRFSQLSIGLFGATFVVSVLTLREIRGSDTGTVPGLSVLLAYLLILTSIVVLILFVHHAGRGTTVPGAARPGAHRPGAAPAARPATPARAPPLPRESTATGTASCGWSSGR